MGAPDRSYKRRAVAFKAAASRHLAGVPTRPARAWTAAISARPPTVGRRARNVAGSSRIARAKVRAVISSGNPVWTKALQGG